MISADVKANKNNKKYKIWWLILQRSTFKTRNTIKMGCIFHSILVGTPFILILFVKSRRVRGRGGEGAGVGVLLTEQNHFGVTKVIC